MTPHDPTQAALDSAALATAALWWAWARIRRAVCKR